MTTLLSLQIAYYLWLLLKIVAPTLPIGDDVSINIYDIIIVISAPLIWVALFNYRGAYSFQRFTSLASEIKIVLKTVFMGTLILIGLNFLIRPGYIPRTVAVLFVGVNFALLSLEKVLSFYVAKVIRKRGYNRKTVLVVGTGGQAKRFMEAIKGNFSWGLDIVGFLDATPEMVGRIIFGKLVLGSYDDILAVMHTYQLDEVIITVSTRRMKEVRNVLEVCEREGVQVRIISNFLGEIAKKIRADVIYGLPILSISYVPDNQIALTIKRGIDILGSLIGLVLLAPVYLITAVAIKLTSPGPIFYQWNVMGFNKASFTSYKFRTMVVGADAMKKDFQCRNEMTGPVFKIKNDPRITPIGRILRKFSLDELPQLWSVLKGDMSLVGPRPAGPHELKRYESWQRRKLSIKPGLTCLWQVAGRNDISDFNEWVRLDLEYIDNWSLWLDCKVLLKTIPAVILGRGAS